MTFVNHMDASTIHINGITNRMENCNITVNFTRCCDPDPENRDVDSDATIITVDFISSFYGYNVTVETDTCQSGCRPLLYYLPDMQPTG